MNSISNYNVTAQKVCTGSGTIMGSLHSFFVLRNYMKNYASKDS